MSGGSVGSLTNYRFTPMGEEAVTNTDGQPRLTSAVQTLQDATTSFGETQVLSLRGRGLGSLKNLSSSLRPTEEGHGAPSGDAQQSTSPAVVKYEQDLAARNAIIKENEAIKSQNAPIEAEIKALEKERAHLDKLFSHDLVRGDDVLTWNELEHLAQYSSDPAQKEAARWLLSRPDLFDSLPKKTTFVGGEGINMSGCAARMGQLQERIAALTAQLTPVKEVPVEPARPGSEPSALSRTSSPDKEPESKQQADARIFSNFNKVPPFSTSSSTAEGRLADASTYLQKRLDALSEDLINASVGGNQGEILAVQAKIQGLQAAMSAVTQMMKQQQELISNMSKMYSDMAMSSIRNMR